MRQELRDGLRNLRIVDVAVVGGVERDLEPLNVFPARIISALNEEAA